MINGTTATDSKICSCGCSALHVIARRETADGRALTILSDGSILAGPTKLSPALRGLGAPRSNYTAGKRAAAVALVLDDLGLYDFAEVATAIKIAETTIGAPFTAGDAARRVFVRRAIAKRGRA